MSNNLIDDARSEEAAHDFLHNVMNWPARTGPFSYEPMKGNSTRLRLHCHLSAVVDSKHAVAPQVEAELRGLAQSLTDEADRVADEWATVESRRAAVESRRG